MQLMIWFLEMVAENVPMLNLLNINCSVHYWLQGVPELLAVQWWSSNLLTKTQSDFLFFPNINLKVLNNSHLRSCRNWNLPREQKMLCERTRYFPKEVFVILFYTLKKKKRKLRWNYGLVLVSSVVWGLLGAAMSKERVMCTEKYKTETCGRKTEHSHPCSSPLQGFVTEG